MDKEREDVERLFAEIAARKGQEYDAPEYAAGVEEDDDDNNDDYDYEYAGMCTRTSHFFFFPLI